MITTASYIHNIITSLHYGCTKLYKTDPALSDHNALLLVFPENSVIDKKQIIGKFVKI